MSRGTQSVNPNQHYVCFKANIMKNNSTYSANQSLFVVHRQNKRKVSRHPLTKIKSDQVHNISFFQKQPGYVLIPNKNETLIILLDDILYAQAYGNYTKIYSRNNTTNLLAKSLKAWLTESDAPFIRCHQSYAINPVHVVSFVDKKYIKLSSKELIPIARRRYQKSLEFFKNSEQLHLPRACKPLSSYQTHARALHHE